MIPEDAANLLALRHKSQGVEFKGPCATQAKQACAAVVRAALGANRRDGEFVVIGVDEHHRPMVAGDVA